MEGSECLDCGRGSSLYDAMDCSEGEALQFHIRGSSLFFLILLRG